MSHFPFRIILKMETPVIIKDYAPSLDGLLYDAVRTRFPENTTDDNLKYLSGILKSTNGVFHASSGLLAVSGEYGVSAKFITRIFSSGHRNLSSEWFAPNGKRPKNSYSAILPNGGHYKNKLTPHAAYGVKQMVFYGCGSIHEVEMLLTYCALGTGFGANGSVQGQYSDVLIERIEEDESFFLDGQLNRVIPDGFAGIEVAGMNPRRSKSRFIPPYFLKEERVDCLVPEPIRYIVL